MCFFHTRATKVVEVTSVELRNQLLSMTLNYHSSMLLAKLRIWVWTKSRYPELGWNQPRNDQSIGSEFLYSHCDKQKSTIQHTFNIIEPVGLATISSCFCWVYLFLVIPVFLRRLSHPYSPTWAKRLFIYITIYI